MRLVDIVERLASITLHVVVGVNWEGEYYEHKTNSVRDALEWAACYPASACVIVFNRLGKVVCGRIETPRNFG